MEIVEQHVLTLSFIKGIDEDEVKIFIDLIKILNKHITTIGFKKALPLKRSHKEFIKYLYETMIEEDESQSDKGDNKESSKTA